MQLINLKPDEYIGQADPFIIEYQNRFYIYTTGKDGVYAYSSDSLFDSWKPEGRVFTFEGCEDFWAPSVIELDGRFYMYCSFEFFGDTPDEGGHRQTMHVSVADSPLGPFKNAKQLLHPFSIDSHVVKNEAGLFIFYSTNNFDWERPGTYICVDKMKDPYTVEGNPVTLITPTLDEEIFRKNRYKQGVHWHTIEGAYYFKEGDYHYLMYSGSCYENENYFIGYAVSDEKENDLTKLHFKKYPDENIFDPLFFSNSFEEGAGHNSMIKYDGQWYAVYHARNRIDDGLPGDRRNARICKIDVDNGKMIAHRFPNSL